MDDIKYKNFDNQDGPTYTLLKSAISSILYQNGTVETFEAAKVESESTEMDFLTAPPSQQTRVQSAQQRGARVTIRDYPVYYEQYRRGRSTQTMGIVSLVSGVIVGGVGCSLILGGFESDYWTYPVLVGGAFIVASVPIMIIGGSKKRSAMNEYLRNVSEAPTQNAPHFQLNLHGNGLGLAYVF
jgi:hypothetical protein